MSKTLAQRSNADSLCLLRQAMTLLLPLVRAGATLQSNFDLSDYKQAKQSHTAQYSPTID